MFLYANGCSWAAGNGVESDPNLILSDPIQERAYYWGKYSWPSRLAEIKKWNFINASAGAGSNQRMIRMTTKFVRNWPKELRNELVVILGWSSIERGEIFVSYDDTKAWCNFNMMQKFSDQWKINTAPWPADILRTIDDYQEIHIKYMADRVNFIERFLTETYTLSMLLEQLNIKYLFFNSFENLSHEIDLKTQYPLEYNYLLNSKFMNICNYSMRQFCKDRGLPISPCHHPMIEGHLEWAKHLSSTYDEHYT